MDNLSMSNYGGGALQTGHDAAQQPVAFDINELIRKELGPGTFTCINSPSL